MKLHASAENYLETIFVLSKRLPYVRSIDIATELSFSKPSVSIAMKNLKQNHLITIDSNGHISLTEEGLKVAISIHDRHTVLSGFLIALGVPEAIAHEDACKIEHDISAESFEKLSAYVKAQGII